MVDYIQQMPTDIVSLIASLYYSPQPPELMKEIRDYKYSLDKIIKIYKRVFHVDIEVYEWLINDIWAWANHHEATMHGHEDCFYKLWERMEPLWASFMLPAYAEYPLKYNRRRPASWYRIDSYISRYFEKKPVKIQFRLFWGLLNCEERREFIISRMAHHGQN